MFALNQGEVCTCPSRALIHESIYDRFMERALKRVEAIVQGNPLDPATMIGAQASSEQMEKILSYFDIGKQEGAEVLIGGERNNARRRSRGRLLRQADGVQGPQQDAHLPGGDLRPGGFGDDLQGRRRGARRSPTTRSMASAPASGAATPTAATASAAPSRRAACGPTATTPIPAHAAFGGYKQSGIGRENHKMMLDHYQQTKNMLVSYSPKKLGFF